MFLMHVMCIIHILARLVENTAERLGYTVGLLHHREITLYLA
jgi:hypothetical protein